MGMVSDSILAEACLDCRVIPNGVDLSVFSPGDKLEARKALGLPTEALVFLFVANRAKDSPYKDYETVEAAVRQIASTRRHPTFFLALGNDSPTARLEGAEIRSIPYERDQTRMAMFYRAADVYLHAARADNHPLAILEALGCGTPVVATGVGGIPEQVRNGETGFIVPARDAAAMTTAAVSLISNPDLRKAFSVRARTDARDRFDVRVQDRRYREWYSEVLTTREP